MGINKPDILLLFKLIILVTYKTTGVDFRLQKTDTKKEYFLKQHAKWYIVSLQPPYYIVKIHILTSFAPWAHFNSSMETLQRAHGDD